MADTASRCDRRHAKHDAAWKNERHPGDLAAISATVKNIATDTEAGQTAAADIARLLKLTLIYSVYSLAAPFISTQGPTPSHALSWSSLTINGIVAAIHFVNLYLRRCYNFWWSTRVSFCHLSLSG